VRLFFAGSQPPIHITPHYLVTSKTPVDAGAPASATYLELKNPPHESFRRLQEERVINEFKESVVQVFPQKLASGPQGSIHEDAKTAPGRPFEMPDGWNQAFGADRFKIAESMFHANMAFTVSITDKRLTKVG
jgi:actin-related protein 4